MQDGIRFGLHHGARLILQMDADFSHDPRYLPEILAHSEHYDLVLGSRYIPGGGTMSWPMHRKLLSRSASFFARCLLGLPTRDCTGGFRCWKASVLENLDIVDLRVDGYAFQFVSLYLARRAGASVAEVPIVFMDRQNGRSKMTRKIAVEAAAILLRLTMHRLIGRAPARAFKKAAGINPETATWRKAA
jgi:dolichol-phosphate mannosyltransferase